MMIYYNFIIFGCGFLQTPRMLNRRGTIPNALYSTPEEFGVRTMLNGSTHLSSTVCKVMGNV